MILDYLRILQKSEWQEKYAYRSTFRLIHLILSESQGHKEPLLFERSFDQLFNSSGAYFVTGQSAYTIANFRKKRSKRKE